MELLWPGSFTFIRAIKSLVKVTCASNRGYILKGLSYEISLNIIVSITSDSFIKIMCVQRSIRFGIVNDYIYKNCGKEIKIYVLYVANIINYNK